MDKACDLYCRTYFRIPLKSLQFLTEILILSAGVARFGESYLKINAWIHTNSKSF